MDPGHSYLLDNLDGPLKTYLRFVKRVGEKYPGNKFPHGGTATQEVLRALIDRVKYVQQQRPWHENVVVLQCLRMALWMLEVRAKHDRGEFIDKSVVEIERLPTCPKCLHIDCTKHASTD